MKPVLGPYGVTIAIATEAYVVFFFNGDSFQVNFCLNYSLRDNGLTDTGAIALAEALLRNKSLEVLK